MEEGRVVPEPMGVVPHGMTTRCKSVHVYIVQCCLLLLEVTLESHFTYYDLCNN